MKQETMVSFTIPFYTQRVTEESWESDGFSDLEEGKSWEIRGCGIASLRMVLAGILVGTEIPPQGQMIQKGLAAEAYQPGVGWIHWGLAKMAEEYGLFAIAHRGKTLEEVAAEMTANRPCILSVTPRFMGGQRTTDGEIYPRGGHLVVAYGYEREEKGDLTAFFIHHPSCFSDGNWPSIRVPVEQLTASFSGNYIAIGEVEL